MERRCRSASEKVVRRWVPVAVIVWGILWVASTNAWAVVGMTVRATPNPAQENQTVTVTVRFDLTQVPPSETLICSDLVVDFGDGRQTRLGSINGPGGTILNRTTTHAYSRPGTYTITAVAQQCLICPILACNTPTDLTRSTQLTVRAAPPRPGQITGLTARPSVVFPGETVTFTVQGTGTCGRLRLDFGDGQSIRLGGAFPLVTTHTYMRAGTYTAVARGEQNCAGTARTRVAVQPPPPPTLQVVPEPTQVSVPTQVTLTLHPVYRCTAVTIDFGDGTRADLGEAPPSTLTTTHTYRTDRTFEVVVQGRCFPEDFTVRRKVLVSRTIGPLSIRRIELRFANGQGMVTVPQHTPKLRAFAEITYSGSGLLQAAWEVDGRIISLVREYLTFGGRVVIASPEPPVLPTFEPGLHRVTLRLDPGTFAPEVPTIFYMVTVGSSGGLTLLQPEDGAMLDRMAVRFRWTGLQEAAQYLLEIRAQDGAKPVLRVLTREPAWTPSMAHIRRLVPGKAYVWQVRGLHAEGQPLAESATRRFLWLPDTSRGVYIPRQVLAGVRLDDGSDVQQRARDIAADFRLRVERITRIRALNIALVRFRIPDDRTVSEVVDAFSKDPRVVWAQPNYLWMTLATARDPMADFQYGLDRTGVREVHTVATGKGVRIAVIDTGVDTHHPELVGRILEVVNVTDRPYIPEMHGTLVTGIIAARAWNGIGITGVAPDARVVVIRACWSQTPERPDGICTSETLARALDAALQRKVQIVHMSIGGPDDPLLRRLIETAATRNVIVVAAAGNGGPDARPIFPAALPDVLAVTAVDAENHLYVHASRGDYIDLAAPGVDVVSTAPGGTFRIASGTSMAAAHVTGIVALILQIRPDLSPERVRAALIRTARDLGPPGKDVLYGYGLVNACPVARKQTDTGLQCTSSR